MTRETAALRGGIQKVHRALNGNRTQAIGALPHGFLPTELPDHPFGGFQTRFSNLTVFKEEWSNLQTPGCAHSGGTKHQRMALTTAVP